MDRCVKCNGEDISIKYDDGNPTQRQIELYGYPPSDFEPEESIIKTCNTCGYIWFDKCLDSN